MEFRCRLATASGEITEGVFVAETEERLRHELEEKGLCVLSLHRKGTIAGLSLGLPQRRTVSPREFLVFNQELATLLRAGMPLVQSLDLLKRRVESPLFRQVLADVHERVRSGSALSDAFAAQGDLFPRVYTASLVAGERSGSLDVVLRRYVDYAKVLATVRRKTLSALLYPAVLVSLSLGLVSIIVLKVVPAFSDFYETFGAELPLMTRVIVRVSMFVRSQILVILVGLAVLVAAAAVGARRAGQRARVDRFILALPALGPIARKFATSQVARTLATLLGGGLPLVQALEVAARSAGNRYIAEQLDVVGARVREGEAFSSALGARGIFPDVAVRMTEVGESTGALQEMLNTVADFYDEDIATSTERFVALIEPALLVIMGVVIAALLLALYMPLFQLSSVLG